jgi:hypothetical protein
MMFHDYRETWMGFPCLEQLDLGGRYKWYRTVMLNTFEKYIPALKLKVYVTSFLKRYHDTERVLENCQECFLPPKPIFLTKDYVEKCRLINQCVIDYRLKEPFSKILRFINFNISIRIDISNEKTLRVYERIADGMISKLPEFKTFTHNDKASLMNLLHFNILDAKREWENYYSTHVLGLPF